MATKKIVIDIKENGEIKAETFGIEGIECIEELDKLMKDLVNSISHEEKKDEFEGRISNASKVKMKIGN